MKQFFILCLTMLITGTVWAKSPSQIYKDVHPSVFSIYSVDKTTQKRLSFGSAVAVSNSILATNCHILMVGDEAFIEIKGEPHPIQLAYKNLKYDLCLFKVSGLHLKPVTLRPAADVTIGERVYAIGNPIGLNKSLSQGIISNKHSVRQYPLLQTDASISRGSSGGGLFDDQGRLIGITTLMARNGNDISLAIPSETIQEGLSSIKKHGIQDTKLPIRPTKGKVLGFYGNKKIALVMHHQQCFVFIFDRPIDQQPTRSIIWWPNHPSYVFIFPVPKEGRSGYLKMDQQYPIRIYQKSKRPPILFTQISKQAVAQIKSGQTVQFFYRANGTVKKTRFKLDGMAQALKRYQKSCNQ